MMLIRIACALLAVLMVACSESDVAAPVPYRKSDSTNSNKSITSTSKVFASSGQSLILKADGSLWHSGFYLSESGIDTRHLVPEKIMNNVSSAAFPYEGYFFLKTDATLWAYGNNSMGQFGNAIDTNNFPDWTPLIQIMTGVSKVSIAEQSTIFLKTDGSVWSVGENYRGQLGDGTRINRKTPVQVMTDVSNIFSGLYRSYFLKKDGTLWFSGINILDTTAILIPTWTMNGVSTVSVSEGHTLILKTDGTLWGYGSNSWGQLGDGTIEDRPLPVKITSGVSRIATGDYHSLILKSDGSLWATGNNWKGQLGDGTTLTRLSPVQIMVGVSDMAGGRTHSVFVKKDGTIWGAGDNENGQLGNGTINDQPTPVKVSL